MHRTLSVQGWSEALQTVERPEILILAVTQRHIIRATDVLATNGSLRVASVQQQLQPSTGGKSKRERCISPDPGIVLGMLAVVHNDATVPMSGDIVAPLYDVPTTNQAVGIDVFLTIGPAPKGFQWM